MRIAVSITRPDEVMIAEESGASLIEARIDLFGSVSGGDCIKELRKSALPVILTLRSKEEGGKFSGTPEEWYNTILPYLEACDYVDIEIRYADYATEIRERGKKIVASTHLAYMPSGEELLKIENSLRRYGDLPKVIVTPEDSADLIALLEFTRKAEKPIITGVMGSKYRYGRILCSLFGSEIIYCRLESPAAEGQYTVAEASSIFDLIC